MNENVDPSTESHPTLCQVSNKPLVDAFADNVRPSSLLKQIALLDCWELLFDCRQQDRLCTPENMLRFAANQQCSFGGQCSLPEIPLTSSSFLSESMFVESLLEVLPHAMKTKHHLVVHQPATISEMKVSTDRHTRSCTHKKLSIVAQCFEESSLVQAKNSPFS